MNVSTYWNHHNSQSTGLENISNWLLSPLFFLPCSKNEEVFEYTEENFTVISGHFGALLSPIFNYKNCERLALKKNSNKSNTLWFCSELFAMRIILVEFLKSTSVFYLMIQPQLHLNRDLMVSKNHELEILPLLCLNIHAWLFQKNILRASLRPQ